MRGVISQPFGSRLSGFTDMISDVGASTAVSVRHRHAVEATQYLTASSLSFANVAWSILENNR